MRKRFAQPITFSILARAPVRVAGKWSRKESSRKFLRAKNSLTADYLSGRVRIAIPKQRAKPRGSSWDQGWRSMASSRRRASTR